ncbi:MAG TPA: DUF4440 domain-containing protein [Comamonas kerstersii]|nr:DUF4440 domain-containing protein [Comamonas kerstersii]
MPPALASSLSGLSRTWMQRWSHWRTASLALAALTFASASLASTAVTEVNQLMAQGKLTEAAALAQAHLSRNGNDVHMRFLQGVIATEQQKYDLAIEIFGALTRDFPNLPEPYNNLAVLYATQGQMQKAAQTLEQATRVNPGYATAYENLGDLYARMAGNAYAQALQRDSNRKDVQPKLALIQQIPLNKSSSTRSVVPANERTPITVSSNTATAAASAARNTSTTAAAATKPTENSAEQQQAKAAIESAIDAWAYAWVHQNMDGYYAAYSSKFAPNKGDLSSWKAERRDRILSKQTITLDVNDLKISVNGSHATARFRQDYSADNYKDSTLKTMELQREGNQWLIVREISAQ